MGDAASGADQRGLPAGYFHLPPAVYSQDLNQAEENLARLLDYEGAEFVLVGARRDPEKAYGVELDAEDEDYGSAEATRRLRLVKSRHPVAPLFEGEWD